MIYLFVLDDSPTSQRFTTRTVELAKCYEPPAEAEGEVMVM